MFRGVHKDLKNALVELGKTLWRSGKLWTYASQHPSTRRATRDDTNTIATCQKNAPHASATATALPTRVVRSILSRMSMSCDAVLKHDTPPKLELA